ncbi:MAG: glutamate racemase, partial [Candidatus Cloacimonadaceae bacterium]|nr:glutamate racemase [Candidatus Cloacimonadaceae bacterium]
SGAYSKAITLRNPQAEVFTKPCPLFVPIVEEGWQDHSIARQVVEEYLGSMKDLSIDTLVLGCTHYPLLSHVIQSYMGDSVKLVDSADAITLHLSSLLPPEHDGKPGKDSFYVSDNEDKFASIASRILNNPMKNLKRVRLFESWFID